MMKLNAKNMIKTFDRITGEFQRRCDHLGYPIDNNEKYKELTKLVTNIEWGDAEGDAEVWAEIFLEIGKLMGKVSVEASLNETWIIRRK